MKIVYVNGYNGQNSSKAKLLKDRYDATHIVLKNSLNIDEVCTKIESIKPNIIVASSTGAYVVDRCKYEDALCIYLNPLIEIEKLTEYGEDISYISSLVKQEQNRIILLNEDDELLDYQKAKEYYKNDNIFIFSKGGHRFKNIDDLYDVLDNIDLYRLDSLFWEFFSREELQEILSKCFGFSRKVIVINTQKTMYELHCDLDKKIKIEDLENDMFLEKGEFLKKLRIEQIKDVAMLDVDI